METNNVVEKAQSPIKKKTAPKVTSGEIMDETTPMDKLFERKNISKRNTIEEQRKKDAEPVRGIFRNLETPGGQITFTYYAYEGDPVVKYTLTDEEICTLPRGVARHLNVNTKYPVHTYSTDEHGRPVEAVGKMVSRYSFQPLDFSDVGDTSILGMADSKIIIPTWRV